MGLDWQGQEQYWRLENGLESKSIELMDGELLISSSELQNRGAIELATLRFVKNFRRHLGKQPIQFSQAAHTKKILIRKRTCVHASGD